jgi:hypothetical protein
MPCARKPVDLARVGAEALGQGSFGGRIKEDTVHTDTLTRECPMHQSAADVQHVLAEVADAPGRAHAETCLASRQRQRVVAKIGDGGAGEDRGGSAA